MSLRPLLSLLRAAVPLLALAAATRAGAQAITLDVDTTSAVLVNRDGCARTFTANWTISASGLTPCATGGDLQVWVTKATTCGNAPASDDEVLGTVTGTVWVSQPTGNFTITASGLPVFTSAAPCPVTTAAPDQKMLVCAHAGYTPALGGACTDIKATASPTITYDNTPPPAPRIDSVDALDSALQINFTASTDVATVSVVYEDKPGPYDYGPQDVPAIDGFVQVTGLTNDVTYAVLLLPKDAAGNDGPQSNARSGTPVESFGFFSTYQKKQGQTTGGCAVAPAGALPLLALGWLARRRRQARGGGRA